MTKPNNFILDTDYLALAQTDKTSFTAYFAPGVFQSGQPYDKTIDFTVKPSLGAIDSYMVSLNGGNYYLGSQIIVSQNSPLLYINIFRTNANTIRVQLHGFTNQAGGYSMPAQTIAIKVSSFKPPNIF